MGRLRKVQGELEILIARKKSLEDDYRRLAEYKWVRLVEFVSAMPKTISGKIKKTELRKG